MLFILNFVHVLKAALLPPCPSHSTVVSIRKRLEPFPAPGEERRVAGGKIETTFSSTHVINIWIKARSEKYPETTEMTSGDFSHSQARIFNETPINPRRCLHILTKIIYLLNQVCELIDKKWSWSLLACVDDDDLLTCQLFLTSTYLFA